MDTQSNSPKFLGEIGILWNSNSTEELFWVEQQTSIVDNVGITILGKCLAVWLVPAFGQLLSLWVAPHSALEHTTYPQRKPA